MRRIVKSLFVLSSLFAASLILSPAIAELSVEKAEVKEVYGLDGIQWQTQTAYKAANLVVVGPDDFRVEQNFGPEDTLYLEFSALAKAAYPTGLYKYELRISPLVNEANKALAEEARAIGQKVDFLVKNHFPVIAGDFSLSNGNIIDRDMPEPTLKDFVINDDLIVDGSACIGFDCVNGESFGFDTLRLKENNLRIKFDDTSTVPSFPANDWQLTANASANGGASKFSIDDISGNRTPFTVEANARSNALYVDDGGRIGSRTSTPSVEIHTIDGDTPTLRLQQDGSSGFAPQTWDVAGNETNFFIRDVTNGSQLPFRIRPDAPTSSIFIDVDGDVGMGTSSPASSLHIDRSSGNVELNLETSAQSWVIRANDTTDEVNYVDNTNSKTPFKIASNSDSNLLRLGNVASNTVQVNGDLVITGNCTEVNGACADYVFEPDYEKLSLDELREFITVNKHLPNVPSTAETMEKGVNMTHFSGRLLEKIEELVLYTLEQQDTIDRQQETIGDLQARIEKVETASN